MSLDLRGLRYFIAVAETLHFGRAAAHLYISQPALSKQIRQLEADLGVPLLRRSTRQASLTAAGRTLLVEGRLALAQFEHAVANARAAGHGDVSNLGVGFVSALASHVIPMTAQEFNRRHPGVNLRLEQSGAEEQLLRLREGELDVGLVWQLGAQPRMEEEFTTDVLTEQPLYMALPEGHQLAEHSHLPLSALSGETWIMTMGSATRGHRADLLALCRRHGFSPRVRAEASGMDTMLGLVRAGFGVCAAPAFSAVAGYEGVAFVPVPEERMRLAAIHTVVDETSTLRVFLDTVQNACDGLARRGRARSR